VTISNLQGYSVVKTAWTFLPDEAKKHDTVCAVLGCGPVGLCGVLSALQRFKTVYAIDSVPARLQQAARYGAIPINLNENPVAVIQAATEGRGVDAVMYDLSSRPFLFGQLMLSPCHSSGRL
jgi:threonine dehydrogenase-like Zn-dependent dehydrogenase